jgi:hypothetical protein
MSRILFSSAASISAMARENSAGSAASTSSILASGTPASASVLILISSTTASAPYRRYPDASRPGSGSRPHWW